MRNVIETRDLSKVETAPRNKSGQTAYGAAMARLIEQYQSDETRLFNDTILGYILPWPFKFALKQKFIRNRMVKLFDKRTKGTYGGLVCRTRYIDEKTLSVLSKGMQQILILGSGFDTRPYRMQEMKNIKVFEVDMASVQNFKRERIKKYLGTLPGNVVYVAIDFNKQALNEVLQPHQFDFSKPTLIIWEGVTQYITKDAVEKTFDFISKVAQESYVIFTYVLESVVNKKSTIEGANELMTFFENKNWPWRFGLDANNVKSFLKKYNLELIEDIGASYYQEKYLKPTGRTLNTTEIERVAFAKRNLNKFNRII